MRKLTLLVLSLGASFAVLTACNHQGGDEHAHKTGSADDHADHGAHEGPDPISITLFTPRVQLFMEYPHLIEGHQADFLAHVTVLATGDPVRSGSMVFTATSADGQPAVLKLEAPRRDGLFVPQWSPDAAGTYQLTLAVDSPQVQETIDVGDVIVHPDEDAALAAAEALPEEPEPANVVPFLLEQQWKIDFLLAQAGTRTLTRRLSVPAKIVAPQGASAAVSPPVAGRLLPPPDGKLPRIGDVVQAGQVLALVEPPLPATEAFQLSANRAQVQALETELSLRELDLDTKALEVEQSLIQAEARLEYAQRRMMRAEELREKGVGTEQQSEEAQQNVRLAEAELQAARAMQKSYQQAKDRLGILRQRATTTPADAGEDPYTLNTLPLKAPITGHIVAVEHIEGEYLDNAHQEVFRIVNTDHVWVQAGISEFDLARLPEQPNALMTLAAFPEKTFNIFDAGGRLVNIGSLVDPETRTISIVYEMPNPDRMLRIGMFAEVHLETELAVDAVAVPEDAIVLDNGQPTVFVLLDGENFQKREIVTGIRDGDSIEIKDGVEPGEWVATKGSYALKLAAQSPESFGHGHVH